MPGPPRLGLSTTIQEQNQCILPISSVHTDQISKPVVSIVIWIRSLVIDKTQNLDPFLWWNPESDSDSEFGPLFCGSPIRKTIIGGAQIRIIFIDQVRI